MSGAGMVWARSRKVGNPTSKALLMLIGELSDDTGGCYRDQRYMAEILEISRETVVRNLAKLEAAGFISRDARYTSEKKRMTDKITLQMERTFTVVNPPADEPETHVTQSHTDPESHVILSAEPCDSDTPSHVTQSHTKRETTSKLKEETTNTPALFEPPVGSAIAVQANTSRAIAQDVHEKTNGAYSFKAAYGIVVWAIKAGYPENEVHRSIGLLWRGGRPLTRATLGQLLEGINVPGQRRPTESTTDARVRQGLDLRDRIRAREEAEQNTREETTA